MYTPRPILWVDADRIAMDDMARLARACAEDKTFLLPCIGSEHPPCGYTYEGWPTPDQLFRWTPAPTLDDITRRMLELR